MLRAWAASSARIEEATILYRAIGVSSIEKSAMPRKHRLDTNQLNTKRVPFSVPDFGYSNYITQNSTYSRPRLRCSFEIGREESTNRSSVSWTRQILYLCRLSTFWIVAFPPCHCALASNGTSGGWQRQEQRFYSSCPFDKVDSCFRRAFSTMPDPSGEMATCDDFERLASCFRYVNCSEKESSEVGARAFLATKRVRLPKEFFSALLTRWRLRCSLECADYEPEECRRSMSPKEQDTDYAFLLELQSLKMQMALLNGGSKNEMCSNYRKAMLRWHVFRLDKCSSGDSTCHCRKEERKLRSVCAVQCDKLHLARTSTASTTARNLFLCALALQFLIPVAV